MVLVWNVGEVCLNVRPQETLAPGHHHPVGGELEGAGRVEEIVGALLEHQPQSLHSPVLLRSKQNTLRSLPPGSVTQLICLDDLHFRRAVFERCSALIQLLNETSRGTEWQKDVCLPEEIVFACLWIFEVSLVNAAQETVLR